jgi:glutaminyl-tRNA synthetase
MTDAAAKPAEASSSETRHDFIRDIIRADLDAGRVKGVVTRFPPEPNGYLHIGHAKSICLNFGVAQEFGGRCHLRFDDTNPVKEEQEYIEAIERDVRWLGFDWGAHLYHASDYFERLYEWAQHLIKGGFAYVDDQSAEEIRAARGTLTEPGTESPFRDRGPDENLDLFARMRAGEFADGARVLRAKIDMASGNINLRDPVLYRILHAHHPRTGDAWSIYPTYDFAHGQSDAIEGITHSLCTLEFEDHRPLYDWLIEHLPVPSRPRQYEFSRLNLTHTVLSKRRLIQLVTEGHVDGWDDPRMPTIAGLRRRGVPPAAIRDFALRTGIAKSEGTVEIALLEACIRELLNKTALRRMAVLRPLKVVIENYPEGQSEELDAVNNPEDAGAGSRKVPFGRELFIERDDFMEDPPSKFFRLAPGREVRLRYAYFVTCNEVVKDAAGNITELRCTYDPATRGDNAPDGRRVKGTIHWVSAAYAIPAEVRLYDHLFASPEPGKIGDYLNDLNPNSLEVLSEAMLEPSLADCPAGVAIQFERMGYFTKDTNSSEVRPIFNRTVTLRDSWSKTRGERVEPSPSRRPPKATERRRVGTAEAYAEATSLPRVNEMNTPDWIRTDEREDAINAIEHVVECARTLPTNPSNWKWVLISLHNALQSALVCVLSGSAGIGALSDTSMKNMLDWFDDSRNDSSLSPPREQLADLMTLYKRSKDPAHMHEFGGNPIQTTHQQDDDVRLLNNLRRNFAHFTPKGWSIEGAGLPRIMRNTVEIIEELLVKHPAARRRLKTKQAKRAKDAIRDLRHIFEEPRRQ